MGEPQPVRAILFVAHSLPPLEYSGTPAIAHAYARHFAARGARVGVLYGTTQPGAVPLRAFADEQFGFTRYEVPTTPHLWHQWSTHDAAAAHPSRSEVLRTILDGFRPDLVHIVDLVNLPGEWPEAIKARDIPILRQVWNAEDLCGLIEPTFPVPPAVTCPTPITPRQCAECCFRRLVSLTIPADTYPAHQLLTRLIVLRGQSVAEFERLLATKRRQAVEAFQRLYDRIVFPMQSFREFFERTLPLPPERTVVVEPGIDLEIDRVPRVELEEPVRFLFLGNLLMKKGTDDLIAVFSHPDLLNRSDYALAIYGGGNAAPLRGLLETNPHVRYAGGYTPGQLPAILRAADVGLSPSRFETFHRVTREYLAAGLPVLGSTAFGIPEAIQDEVNGLVFEAGDGNQFRRAVLRVLDDRRVLMRLRNGAGQSVMRTVREEIEAIEGQHTVILAASAHRGAALA